MMLVRRLVDRKRILWRRMPAELPKRLVNPRGPWLGDFDSKTGAVRAEFRSCG